MTISPVLLEILNNKVSSITEEVGYTIRRIGHSLFVKEIADFGTALATVEGKFFAYPSAIGVANFIDLDCGPTVRAVGDLKPGDVIITNHPYRSEGLSTHTPDINLVVPYFNEGKLVCLGWSFLHISDMSGKVPGSISPSSTELFQEGFLIPPMKLVSEGRMNEDLLNLMMANTRTPEANLGDLKAMLAAHKFGEKRVGEVIRQHGLDVFMEAQQALIDYSGLKAREVMRKFEDGVYEFWDYLDDDMLTDIPMRLRVKMTIKDGAVDLDFTGTDPQTSASYNMVTAGKRHAYLTGGLLMLIMTMDPSIPRNCGIFKYVTTSLPQGSVVNPVAPASVGVRHAIAMRCKDLVQGALLKATPELLPACAAGIIIPLVFAEPPTDGESKVLVLELMVGGQGAGHGLDGVDGRGGSLANMVNNPIEIVEDSAAVRVKSFRLRPDSGGAGKWRGGNGLILTFEALRDECMVLGRGMERFRFQPWGALGGAPGSAAQNVINIGRNNEQRLGKIDVVRLNKGDTFTVMTPGGGGYGDPFERDPEAVLRDVQCGAISLQVASEAYGVVIDDGALDQEATAALRAERSTGDNAPIFTFGAEREAWERSCGDERSSALVATLERFPASERFHRRKTFFEEIFPELRNGKVKLSELEEVGPERWERAIKSLTPAATAH